jgi:hypothetical protein
MDPIEVRQRLARELERSRRAIAVAAALTAIAAESRRRRQLSAESDGRHIRRGRSPERRRDQDSDRRDPDRA